VFRRKQLEEHYNAFRRLKRVEIVCQGTNSRPPDIFRRPVGTPDSLASEKTKMEATDGGAGLRSYFPSQNRRF
jgi:hypothetical protein